MKALLKIFFCCFLLFSLAACLADKNTTGSDPSQIASEEQALQKETIVTTADSLPNHTQAVLSALLSGMRGEKVRVRNVSFDPKGEHDLGGQYADYKHFGVVATEVDLDMVVPVNKTTSLGVLRGVFNFVSDIGQKRSEFFFANYTITKKKKLVITESVSGPVYPEFPDTVCFFLKHEDLAAAAEQLTSIRSLFLFALANSIDVFATPEEVEKKDEYEQLSFFQKMKSTGLMRRPKNEELAILVFMMDRISPVARFEATMTNAKNGGSSGPVKPTYLFDDVGYGVAIFQGKGKLFDRNKPFYVHAYYAQEDAKLERISMYSSGLFYDEVESVSPPGSKWMESALKSSKMHSRLFNLRDRNDARKVQQALKDKGYYTTKVDGLFGKGSKKALRAYKKSEMGLDDYKWNMNTQKQLFE